MHLLVFWVALCSFAVRVQTVDRFAESTQFSTQVFTNNTILWQSASSATDSATDSFLRSAEHAILEPSSVPASHLGCAEKFNTTSPKAICPHTNTHDPPNPKSLDNVLSIVEAIAAVASVVVAITIYKRTMLKRVERNENDYDVEMSNLSRDSSTRTNRPPTADHVGLGPSVATLPLPYV